MVEVVGAAEGALKGARDVAQRAAAPERVQRRRSRLFLFAALASFAGYLFLLLRVRANRQFRADLAATLAATFACVITTPLGVPVEPEVSW